MKYAAMINGVTQLVMMKSDVLDSFAHIKVCTAYTKDGVVTTDMPYDLNGWQPVYDELPGWKCDLTAMTSEEEFPQALNNYISYIERYMGIPITIVSVGPDRRATIVRS